MADQLEDEQNRTQEHDHPNGLRCCGRPIVEKCSPEERAANTNPATGQKTCCQGKH